MMTAAADLTSDTLAERALHIRLPQALHRGVRVAAAEDDVSVQEWVRRALAEVLRARAASPPIQ